MIADNQDNITPVKELITCWTVQEAEDLLKQLIKALVEQAFEAEMAEHPGHGKNKPVENTSRYTRHGRKASSVHYR